MSASTRLIVGPFNRVEGDLEVTLDIRDGAVAEARVTAPLYRGFEQILLGRPAGDALVIAPRICGLCSVSQSVAAARALAPPKFNPASDMQLEAPKKKKQADVEVENDDAEEEKPKKKKKKVIMIIMQPYQ